MPEYIGQDGLRRHIPRRDRKRARPMHPAAVILLVVLGLGLPVGLLIAIVYLARILPDLTPLLIVGTVLLLLIGGALAAFLLPNRPR